MGKRWIPEIMRTVFVTVIIFLFISCETPESEFEKAKEENTIQAYKNFLSKYPDHKLKAEAENQIVKLEYLIFSKKPSLKALLDLIEKYQGNNYLDSAQARLLEVKDYSGLKMKAELISYKGKKELLALFPNKLHYSKSPAFYLIDGGMTKIEDGKKSGKLDVLDKELNENNPAFKVTFYNFLDSTKKLAIDNLNDLIILASMEKSNSPIGISAMDFSEPWATIFPPAKISDWELRFTIPGKDSIEIGYLSTEAKKGDMVIFDSAFVTTIK
jgi:hypothetical protein